MILKEVKMKFTIFTVVLFGLIFSLGCSKDDEKEQPDTIKPQVNISSPTDGQLITRGSPLVFNANLTDNRELDRCEIAMSHLKSSTGIDEPWTPQKHTVFVQGKDYSIKNESLFEATIPFDILSGEYSLLVAVYDKAGNYLNYNIEVNIQ